MSASLVGSEMCIRDSFGAPEALFAGRGGWWLCILASCIERGRSGSGGSGPAGMQESARSGQGCAR
eukprot:1553895-Alexandrium_andersonii.AAC.1